MPDPTTPNPRTGQSIFQDAFNAAHQELQQEYQAASDKAASGGNILTGTLDAVNSVGLGIAKSLIETKEFLTGEPNYEDKWPIQKQIEADAAELDRRSGINAVVGDISQFATGMVGLGKVTAPIKALQGLSKGGKLALEIAKGAAVGSAVFDPQEQRFSNLIESYPELHNPVTEYLSANLSDTDAEGRFKNALEGAGLDLALAGTFAAAVKLFKFTKGGADSKLVEAAQEELDAAIANQKSFEDAYGAIADQQAKEADQLTNQGSFEQAYGDLADQQVHEGNRPPNQDDFERAYYDEDIPSSAGKQSQPGSAPEVGADLPGTGTPEDPTVLPKSEVSAEGAPTPAVPDAVTQAAPAPKAPPVPRNPIDVQTEDLNALMDGWRKDSEAIRQYGSREAAEANGYTFGQAGQLPWQKLQGEGDMRAFTDRVAETFKSDMDKMKGGDVLTDDRVNFMVGQRAWLYGDDPATVMGMLRQAGKGANAMAANMEAGFMIANKALSDTYRLASQIRQGSLHDFGGDALAAERALRQRLALSVEALGNSRAMTAAAGRTLRRMRNEFRITPQQLAQLEGLDIDRIVSLIYESQGNPKKLAKIADPGWLDRAVRGTGSIMANNLLWGWPSHVVNTVTSAYMAGIRPAERIVGSYVMGGGSSMRTRALREYRYMASAIGDAWHAASQAFLTGDSVLAPNASEWFKAASNTLDGATPATTKLGFVPMNTVGDAFKNGLTAIDFGLRLPTRALGTVDEFIKQTSYRGYVQAEASIKADELGLKGADFRAYVEKALDDAFDEAYRATDKNALYEAQVRTFSQPLLPKTIGSTLQNAVAVHPSLRAIFPFVRTPINVFRYSLKMMPFLNLAQGEYRQMISGKMGPELQANAIGQFVTGSLALTTAGILTADGRITGGGPKEPALRKALEATGWKPYSFVWENPDGSHTYVPFNRFDPVGMLFGIAADVTEIGVTYPDEDLSGLALALAIATAKNIGDKTYLQNINAFMRAASDPEASGSKFVGQFLEGNIPFSSMLRQMNPDPYMREARSLVDNTLDRMPGYSDKLPPLRDPFGYPMQISTGLVFQDNANDIVDAEQMRLILETGKGISLPTGYRRNGMDLRDMRLSVDGKDRTAWDLLQEISIKPEGAQVTMKEALAKEIQSERYGMAPDGDPDVPGTKLFLLRRIVSKYREAGYKELVRKYPKEVGEPLARRAMEAKEAWRQTQEKGQASQSQVQQLRNFAAQYGITTQ